MRRHGTQQPTRRPTTVLPRLDYALTIEADRRGDRKTLAVAMSFAVAAHLAFLLARLPVAPPLRVDFPVEPDIFLLNDVLLRPDRPLPAPTLPPEPAPSARPVPVPELLVALVPDLEPLPPAPLPAPEMLAPVLALPAFPAPPPVPDEALQVGGDVQAPVRLPGAVPQYTEIARRARRQGVVILEAVIDRMGAVSDLTLVRGLGLGLDEAALDAVRGWRFEPGTLHGRPVPVRYHLTVRYSLR